MRAWAAMVVGAMSLGAAAPGQHRLAFEANRGQWDSRVRFAAHARMGSAWLTNEGIVVTLPSAPGAPAELTVRVVGADGRATPVGADPLPGTASYLLGNDPSRWTRGVPTFGTVRYPRIRPGVDLVVHGADGELEYDLACAPDADLDSLRFRFDGAGAMHLDAEGDLVLRLAGGDVVQHRPRVYENGRELPARYVIGEAGEVALRIARHDPRRAILVDPVLTFSSYLGGNARDFAYAVAVDDAGAAYVVGSTFSANFPKTQAAYQGTLLGVENAFVTKLPTDGGAYEYSTYLGGSGGDGASAVAVDATGTAYLAGWTYSSDFPVMNGFQTKLGDGGAIDPCVFTLPDGGNAYQGPTNAFVAKISPQGDALLYSTYLGGSGDDEARAIAIDDTGIYVGGYSGSYDFPVTPNALQSTYATCYDAFVAKIDLSGALAFSTYLGGQYVDQANALAVDRQGNVYAAGQTQSLNFPTVAPYQSSNKATDYANGGYTAFLSKLNRVGSALLYSTYFGGTGDDEARGVALDAADQPTVVGITNSGNDFPLKNPSQAIIGGSFDAFVTRFAADGQSLVFSTFFGGLHSDRANGVALDAFDNVYVAGTSYSTGLPVTPGAAQFDAGGLEDAFELEMDCNGFPRYATYLGGTGNDYGFSIAVTGSGAVTMVGQTGSNTNFPTMAPSQAVYGGGLFDGYVATFAPGGPGGPLCGPDAGAADSGASDSGTADAGVRDGGSVDAGSPSTPEGYSANGWACSCAGGGGEAVAAALLLGLAAISRRKR